MAQDNDKKDSKGIGTGEVAAGVAAGATAAHFAGKHVGMKQLEEVESKVMSATMEAFDAFKAANPMPAVASMADLSSPAVEAWQAGAKAAAEKATEPLMEKAFSLANPLTRPVTAFRNASTPTKIAMGAAVAAATLGAAWAVNKWRNSGQSHVERLEAERSNVSNERSV